jgi:hypothetical protein
VAVNDLASIPCWSSRTLNLIGNDTDPENNLPLELVSVTLWSGTASATIVSSTSVQVDTADRGQSIFKYSVRDSLGATTTTGQLTVNSTGPVLTCSGGGLN